MNKRLIIECNSDDAYTQILKLESAGDIKVVDDLANGKPKNTDDASGEPNEEVVEKLDDYKLRM